MQSTRGVQIVFRIMKSVVSIKLAASPKADIDVSREYFVDDMCPKCGFGPAQG